MCKINKKSKDIDSSPNVVYPAKCHTLPVQFEDGRPASTGTKDYEALYKALVNEITSQYQYWLDKASEQYSVESEIRWSTYNRLRAFIYGQEHNIQNKKNRV